MGAPNPQASDAVRDIKEAQRTMGEPLNRETRTVQERAGSKLICVTQYAAATHNIEKGDDLAIETYADRVVIYPQSENEQ